ncbi:hypothetical protein BKA70DRAFT_273103 [Coprinopsis sp. MPI-PUGE-AT-0042]|nr:hypothetical protein BKA70DRAFT_273103 [Coprinopsis sp. MPI-PUGE-AT-0042]
MLFFSYDTSSFARALRPGPPEIDLVVDNALALAVLSGFFVKQVIAFRDFKRHLRRRNFERPSQAGRGFGIAHIVLIIAFLFSVFVTLATLCMKLAAVRHIEPFIASGICPPGQVAAYLLPGMCAEKDWDSFIRIIYGIDASNDGLLQLMLLLSDGLLVYQCYTAIERPLVHLVTIATLLRVGLVAFTVLMAFIDDYASMRSAYGSLLATFIASMTALVWLCWGQQEAKISLGSTALNTTKLRREESIKTVAKSLFYAVVSGLAHLGVLVNLGKMFITLNIIWVACLIMLSQTLALCFLKENLKEDEHADDLGLDGISLPVDGAESDPMLANGAGEQESAIRLA